MVESCHVTFQRLGRDPSQGVPHKRRHLSRLRVDNTGTGQHGQLVTITVTGAQVENFVIIMVTSILYLLQLC